ncbi:MAG TPA: flagellar protein FlgN, partial [Oxalobacteraceae bacterium]|nr:flagellar protein FlgN [Oxalobacteraceae bacterium]
MQSFGTSPADSLDEELDGIRRLLQLLKQEQAQLVAANVDGLPALTEQKARIVAT